VTFWEHFLRLLSRRPKPALAALYWHLTRRRVRARNRLRVASADLSFFYAAWIRSNERSAELAARCASVLQDSDWHPSFCVLLHSPGSYSDEQLARSRTSIDGQTYPRWRISGPTSSDAEVTADVDFIVPLRVGDQLSSAALFRFAEAARANRDASILYGDEDYLDERGRRGRPWFKPEWNSEMFLALDYLTSCAAIRAGLARQILPNNQPKDLSALLLAASGAAEGSIVHVSHILCHVDAAREQHSDRLAMVAEHVKPFGAICTAGALGTLKVQWPLPERLPLVSVIIATRDKLELLRPCLEGVLERTDYSNVEILIVDNGSVEQRTRAYLEEVSCRPNLRVLPFAEPFNFSAINNFAARQASGSFLCLLNNDTEVVEPTWLTELMRYAVRPEVGAAGAKLLYEDGSIQHAGITIGIGEAAGHAHRSLAAGELGYFRMPHVAHYVSAVTAACLVIDKNKFDGVGGLDEASLAVAFNDVDLCLKLEKAEWRNVYVPHAVLLHHESRSRGKDSSRRNIERYRRELSVLQERWGTKAYADPLHNPNLDRYSESYILRL
jgi:O-antigen biosynthesis protein